MAFASWQIMAKSKGPAFQNLFRIVLVRGSITVPSTSCKKKTYWLLLVHINILIVISKLFQHIRRLTVRYFIPLQVAWYLLVLFWFQYCLWLSMSSCINLLSIQVTKPDVKNCTNICACSFGWTRSIQQTHELSLGNHSINYFT
jgi:hypothetical protein